MQSQARSWRVATTRKNVDRTKLAAATSWRMDSTSAASSSPAVSNPRSPRASAARPTRFAQTVRLKRMGLLSSMARGPETQEVLRKMGKSCEEGPLEGGPGEGRGAVGPVEGG